jgi:glycerophosphoryl diester phosphodiesterase
VQFGFLAARTPIAFAHRGFAVGADHGLENTMRAFEAAVGLGYRYLETDVRVSSDGVALAFHDATLDRVTHGHGRVAAQPWSRLRHARIAGREPITLLTDLLAAWPDVRVNLDIKDERGVGATVAAVRRTGSLERVCVGSFAAHRVAAARRALGPRLCTSLGPRAALGLRLPAAGVLPGARPPVAQCAQVPARLGGRPFVDARYLAAAHRRGLQVHAWTVNDSAGMTRLLDLGVDGIMTDRADVLRDLLVERGQW